MEYDLGYRFQWNFHLWFDAAKSAEIQQCCKSKKGKTVSNNLKIIITTFKIFGFCVSLSKQVCSKNIFFGKA